MKKIATFALAASLMSASAFAGNYDPKVPMVEDPVCAVPFTGSVSFGYETDYIFRGVELGHNAPWAAVDLNYEISDAVSIDVGTWYLNSTSRPELFDELDVYGFLNFPLGPLSASLGGTWYYFPETGGDTGEASLELAYDLGFFELSGFAAHDFVPNGWYFQLAGEKSIPLTDCLDLGLGAGVSYGDQYFGVNGWNHAFAVLSLTCHLTDSAALSGYVGGNFPLEELENAGEDDDVHGGVSLSVSF